MAHNPIAAGEHLLTQYRAKCRFALERNGLSSESIEHILTSMQIDSGIYLSLNPAYEQSDEPFANFAREHHLPEKLGLLPDLAEKCLYTHQKQGILSILDGNDTIIATGTGSGKTEIFLIPILAHCLQSTERGVKAIIIYPMNALAGDQLVRIGRYTQDTDITFGLYTGATPESAASEQVERHFKNQLIYRNEIRENPPDILITNYVMLDRMLTRESDRHIFAASAGTLRYIVLDELHAYTGSKATHLKYLLARLRHYWRNKPTYVATSASLGSDETDKSLLDTFLQHLLNIGSGNYTFVEAVKDEFYASSVQPPLLFTSDEVGDLDFSTEDRAAESIGILVGQNVDAFDFYSASVPFHESTSIPAAALKSLC